VLCSYVKPLAFSATNLLTRVPRINTETSILADDKKVVDARQLAAVCVNQYKVDAVD
jgi:hypothetical protein